MSAPSSITVRIPATVTVNGESSDAHGSYRQQLIALCELDLGQLHELSTMDTPRGKLAEQAALLLARADYRARGSLGCSSI